MKKLGSYKINDGYEFRVYAPNANDVKVLINSDKIDMNKDENGIWEVFVAGIKEDQRYAYIIDGVEKIDLYARKVVEYKSNSPKAVTFDSKYRFSNSKQNKPIEKILEVYLENLKGYTIRDRLNYILEKAKGYSHIQFMPLNYTPNKKTLGYKTSNYFAPNPTFGNLDDIKEMIDILHGHNYGVILDFCIFEFEEFTSNGLKMYDGSPVYEYDDRRQHPIFTGYIFDLRKIATQNLIKSIVEFYIEELQVDGLRIDGINEIIFKDQDTQKEINEENLTFFRNLINDLNEEILVICDLITHKTLSELQLERITYAEGSLLQFQLHKIFHKGYSWFKLNKDFESDLLRKTLDMIKNSKVLCTINHDVHINGVQGILRNNALSDEKTANTYKMILYSIPRPKQLWYDIELSSEFTNFIDSLVFDNFDFEVIDSGIIKFIYSNSEKTTTLIFDIFKNELSMEEKNNV